MSHDLGKNLINARSFLVSSCLIHFGNESLIVGVVGLDRLSSVSYGFNLVCHVELLVDGSI